MAKFSKLLFLSMMTLSVSAVAADCSNTPSEDEKRLLCAGETHPLALKLCAESLTIKRDRYGRIISHSYKADATIPEMALLSKMCDVALMPDKSEKAVSECRSTMRVKVNLEGKPVGYSYKIGTHSVDMLLDKSGVKQVGDGGYLCKEEPANTLNRKVCMDGLSFEQEGDFITTYTRHSIANFASDEDAKSVCKDEKLGSKEYDYCMANTRVYKKVDGTISFIKKPESSMTADFKGLEPICERKTPKAVTAIEPAKPEVVAEEREEYSAPPVMQIGRVPSTSSKCEGLKGDELKQCITGATGESTLLSFDGCKAVWGTRDGKASLGEKAGSDRPGAPMPAAGKPKVQQE